MKHAQLRIFPCGYHYERAGMVARVIESGVATKRSRAYTVQLLRNLRATDSFAFARRIHYFEPHYVT